MARARIGKLFHLTPLVDSLPDAEFFFNAVFSPAVHDAQLLVALAPSRGDLHHRGDVDRADAAASRPSPATRPPAGSATSTVRPARPQHRVLRRRPRRPRAASRRRPGCASPTADSGTTVFCHPKDTPGMLEFHPATGGHWEGLDPRFRAEWPAFRDDVLVGHHPLGLQRLSHITVVVDDLAAAEKFYVEVLDAAPLARPGGDGRGRDRAPRAGGRGHHHRAARTGRHRLDRRPRPRPGRSVGHRRDVHRERRRRPGRMAGARGHPRGRGHRSRGPGRHRRHVGVRVPLHRSGAHRRPRV